MSSLQASESGRLTAAPPLPSFNEIYASHCSYVWNSLRRLGVHSRDQEDLVHDIFVIANRRLADFDTRRSLQPWLYGITLRGASDYRKSARNRREVLTAQPAEQEHGPSRPDDEMNATQNRELIREALDSLKFENRVIFVMHDINEHTMAEATEELGVPMPTLYSRLKVAREQFSAAVQRIRKRQSHAIGSLA